jgi:hypothetical protein
MKGRPVAGRPLIGRLAFSYRYSNARKDNEQVTKIIFPSSQLRLKPIKFED